MGFWTASRRMAKWLRCGSNVNEEFKLSRDHILAQSELFGLGAIGLESSDGRCVGVMQRGRRNGIGKWWMDG